MRKITFLVAFLLVTLTLQAQIVYNFNTDGDDQGWVQGGAPGWEVASGVYSVKGDEVSPGSYEFPGGYPFVRQDTEFSPALSATEYLYVRVILENLTSEPTLQLGNFDQGDNSWGTAVKVDFDAPIGAGFNEYTIPIPASNNTNNDIYKLGIRIKSGPTITGTLNIDEIQILTELEAPEQLVFEFDTDGDSEGWTENFSTISVSGDVLTLTPNVGEAAKIIQSLISIDAEAYPYFHIVYRNLSADNNQIRVQWQSPVDAYASYKGKNETINQSMATYETISVDLYNHQNGGVNYWRGLTQNFQIIVRNTNNAGNNASAGDFLIERIIYSNSDTLSLDELSFASLSVFPNPAKNSVNIKGVENLSKVELFDISGKLVLTTNELINDSVNISSLTSGIYLIRITDTNNNSLTKKLIVNQ